MAAEKRRARKWLWILPGAVIIAVLVTCAALYALPTLVEMTSPPPPRLKIIGQNCGEVEPGAGETSIGYSYSNDPDEGELCLWRAYTACRAATLVVPFIGVDAGVTHAIIVQPKAGQCAVTDAVLGYYYAGYEGTKYSLSTYQCAGLRHQQGGLLLSGCGGERDLFIPPRPPEQAGHVCGVLGNAANRDMTEGGFIGQDTITGIEDCFWNAYVTCARPATLLYYNALVPTNSETSGGYEYHTLVVQPSHGSCALTDVVVTSRPPYTQPPNDQPGVKYTCASLTRGADGGLEAQGCGAEMHVIIPSGDSAPFQ